MIQRLLHRHRRFEALVVAAVDGRLDSAGQAAFERHLAGCSRCRAAFEAQRALRNALASLPLHEPSRSHRLTPAMLAEARPAPARVPPSLIVAARLSAAAAVAAFALTAAFTLAGGGDEGSRELAAPEVKDAPGADIMAAGTQSPEDARSSAPETPELAPTPVPGIASPPGGGASGAGAMSPTPEPPQTGRPEPTPAEAGGESVAPFATGAESPTAPDGAPPADTLVPTATAPADDSPPRWPLALAGVLAAAAVTALAALEFRRRRSS
ncbi:anti-sigma factor family protein [Tepidiforma sp.]|uniref:anti-sigma factor family protein n=1 Tax=Tepidiforma sp. TaxID=2682230 RepID=UPI002ADDD732|nr:zf-HC2 domain-containing protein [Tepidiforma sp.]